MTHTTLKTCEGLYILIVLLAFTMLCDAEDRPYFVGVYGGLTTERDLQSLATLHYGDFINSHIAVFSLGKILKTYDDVPLRWECEGQLAKHWGYQQHWENNAALVLRWLDFPWDRRLDTSFAIGEGLSYASEKPKMELDKLGDTSNLLNYLMLEWECKVPRYDRWSVFARIHHRSGIYGLINNVSGGSNMVTCGVRLRF